ncbi:LytR/AlgR family response regulator transcription factor [Caldimonas tepidiphila]|uniref:LytR/AlgR family response regulator transcription factor n=1 Tax=Caldimonas tepidiphila TaxID=2315841 RepID=UPI000E5A2518|nr:LytTR family DNA-binding domain-containing protein [Caldimonas tepidiphila]
MLNVLIVDDEELARMRLRCLVQDNPDPLSVATGEAASATEALAWLDANRCDVVLLDVQMPGMDGTALAARLRERSPAPAVVFVTAHAEHAVAAFELDAVDYLTKPVRRERLQTALQRAAERLRARGVPAADEEPVLVVNDRGRVIRVPVSEVLYLKAELKYVTLRTAQHSYVLDDSLAELEERLGGRFLRIHRNALVARRAVRAMERRALAAGEGEEGAKEGWAVRVEGLDEWLAVSRRQMSQVREALLGEGA